MKGFFVFIFCLSKYLDSVLGGIEYFLINKNPVPRNHFGTHKWFSEIK